MHYYLLVSRVAVFFRYSVERLQHWASPALGISSIGRIYGVSLPRPLRNLTTQTQ